MERDHVGKPQLGVVQLVRGQLAGSFLGGRHMGRGQVGEGDSQGQAEGQGRQGPPRLGGARLMKQKAANVYIGLVAALGLIVLVASSINVRTSAIDPIMFIFIMALVGIAQRNPVVLFRSSAISVAFAVKIAAYVLFGTPLALWATIVVVAVNAYTPKPKPARKVLFNFGQLMLATYLASSTYQLVGGMVPPGAFVPTMLAVAVSAAVYFAVSSVLTAAVIALTSAARFVDVWLQNFAWMPVNYLATAVNGAALALAYQSLGGIGVIVFVLPLGIAWY